MKKIFLILYTGISLLSKAQINKTYLFGRHWAGNCLNTTCDTFAYKAYKTYDADLYQWGGNAEGKYFFKDNTANTYHNVLCSSESDPKDLFASKWRWDNNMLIIDSYTMTETYKVLKLTKNTMLLKLVAYTTKGFKPARGD